MTLREITPLSTASRLYQQLECQRNADDLTTALAAMYLGAAAHGDVEPAEAALDVLRLGVGFEPSGHDAHLYAAACWLAVSLVVGRHHAADAHKAAERHLSAARELRHEVLGGVA